MSFAEMRPNTRYCEHFEKNIKYGIKISIIN